MSSSSALLRVESSACSVENTRHLSCAVLYYSHKMHSDTDHTFCDILTLMLLLTPSTAYDEVLACADVQRLFQLLISIRADVLLNVVISLSFIVTLL